MAKQEITINSTYIITALFLSVGFCGSLIIHLYRTTVKGIWGRIDKLELTSTKNTDNISTVEKNLEGEKEKLDGHISKCVREHRND